MTMQTELAFPTTESVCGLVAVDPANQPSVDAFILALRHAALEHHGTITANHVRPHLPAWVNPRVVSSLYNALQKGDLPVLERMPRADEPNVDRRGRNGNKTLPWYRVHLDRLP